MVPGGVVRHLPLHHAVALLALYLNHLAVYLDLGDVNSGHSATRREHCLRKRGGAVRLWGEQQREGKQQETRRHDIMSNQSDHRYPPRLREG